MAKTTGKKPSARTKSAPAGKSVRASDRKTSGLAVKIAPKPVKKVARPVERPSARSLIKAPAPKVLPGKHKPEMVMKVKPERPAKPQVSAPKLPSRPVSSPAPAIAEVPQSTAPVNGKPRKNPTGFSSRDLEHFRDLLLAKRRELIGDMSSLEHEALRVGGGSNLSNLPIHMADMGTDNYEQEFTLGLVQKERDLLKEINVALAKIQNGTYGLCEGTGLPIVKERLEYQPWARFSVEHQRKLERHGR